MIKKKSKVCFQSFSPKYCFSHSFTWFCCYISFNIAVGHFLPSEMIL